jgi:hypothetical protein
MNTNIKLDITKLNVHELLDQPTLVSYLGNGVDDIIERNRPFYDSSREICVNGVYFALTSFTEMGVEFNVLSLYKKSPRAKKTYRYAFGAYDPDKNDLVWFFNAQPIADNREIAVKTFAPLRLWCKENHPNYVPFAYKR